jgi:hypothetical protein
MHLRYKQYCHSTNVGCWFYSRYTCINKNNPCTGPEGFGKFQYSRHVKLLRSALRTGRLYLPKRIMAMKNSIDTIGNRTRDLPTCSSLPQPTASPRSAIHVSSSHILSPDKTVWKEEAKPSCDVVSTQEYVNESLLGKSWFSRPYSCISAYFLSESRYCIISVTF